MIYADFNGSAPICKEVRDFLIKRLESDEFANPNSTHALGKKIMFKMEKSRRDLAKILGCKPGQIIFNSGSSEGISHVFHSLLSCGPHNDKNIIITSGIEHAAIVQCCALYEQNGYEVHTIQTKSNGVLDLNHLQALLKEYGPRVALLTAMAANNENGIIQPYQKIGELAGEYGVLYFSDTTQFIGKTHFDFSKSNMDFAVLSSHKVGSLIGSGAIIAKNPEHIKPYILGGGQEHGLRGGTQNYIGVEAMALAMQRFDENKSHLADVTKLREDFERKLKEKFPEIVIIGENSPRLATTTMIAHPGISGQAVQIELEVHGIMVTTSSACSDKKPGASRVLKAQGVTDEIGSGVVRISLCCGAGAEVYDQIETALTNAYNKYR